MRLSVFGAAQRERVLPRIQGNLKGDGNANMGLEDNIAEAIVMAMDELAGSPHKAVESALECHSPAQWIKQETAKLAIVGGAEMVVPGLHAFTIPTGVSYLLHKMGYIQLGHWRVERRLCGGDDGVFRFAQYTGAVGEPSQFRRQHH